MDMPITDVTSNAEQWEFGVMKLFIESRGYGFIERNGKEDVFIHHGIIEGSRLKPVDLPPYTRVKFTLRHKKEGKSTEVVKIVIVA